MMAQSAAGQNIQYNQGSTGSGLDNTLQIQLRAYPGRGQASLPVTLYYSSKVWRIKYKGTIFNPYVRAESEPMTEARYAEYSAAGWTSSLGVPTLEWPENNQVYDYQGKSVCLDCHNPALSPGNYWKVPRLTIHMPDGSAHELRRDDTPYTGPVSNSGTYYAVDGSRLRYDTSTGTLYLADGARYVLGADTTRFIDRNGNTLSFNNSTRQWTDTMGRSLAAPPLVGDSPGNYSYSVPGVDGTPVTYTFRWTFLYSVLEPDPVTGAVPQIGYAGSSYTNGTPSYNNPPQALPGPYLFQSSGNEAGTIDHVISPQALFNPPVLSEIVLPNGTSYKFTYNEYGEIAKVIYPTGGFEQYKYGKVLALNSLDAPYDQGNRGVISRWVSPNGTGTDRVQWQNGVTYDAGNNKYRQWTINPDNTYTESYLFKAPPISQYTNLDYPKFGYEDPRNGMVYDTRVYEYQNGPMLRRRLIDSTYSSRDVTVQFNGQTTTAAARRNPRQVKEVGVILDTGGNALAKTNTYAYDTTYQFSTGLNMVASTESQFTSISQTTAQTGEIGVLTSEQVASTAVTTYLDDQNYRNLNILGLATSVTLENSNGQPVSKTVMAYDETPLQLYNDFGGDWTDPGTYRGNLTTVRRYIDASAVEIPLNQECPAGVCLDVHAYFDQAGNVWKTRNERGIEAETTYSATYKHAYATGAKTAAADLSGAHGSTAPFISSSVYDYTTGLVLSTTDADLQTTTFSYLDEQGTPDPMGRLRKIVRPDNSVTTYDYHDAVGDMYVETMSSLDSGRSTRARQYFDKLGRSVRALAFENTDINAQWIASDTYFDAMGRVSRASNPYRTASPGAVPPSSCSVCTTTIYDALGRVKTVTLPDATTLQTGYQGVYTTVTDQAGKQRRQKVDALGRIERVDEPDASGNLGSVDAPAQATYYYYDTQGNLVHVRQGEGTQAQHRYFKYDSLSRLTYEFQVEPKAAPFTAGDPLTGNGQWTRKLVYDETIEGVSYQGMLTSMWDARQIRTQYQYDRLGRSTRVSYSDNVTPAASYFYDAVRYTASGDERANHNLGRLAEVQTEALGAVPSTSQAYNYDLMGRVANNRQSVGVNSYTMLYRYYLGGALKSEQYPSGRVVSYAYDDAARLNNVSSGSQAYAASFVYGPRGLLTSLTYGNGVTESFDYNNRLQLKELSLTKDNNTIERYVYQYGRVDIDTGSLDQSKNNGQIAAIEAFTGSQKQSQQHYAYDSLGRLSAAAQYSGDNTPQLIYRNNYAYDRFGNRSQSTADNPSFNHPLPFVSVLASDINPSNNRFFSSSSFDYDNAGNVTLDNKFSMRQYSYDANNRQRNVSRTDGVGGTYISVYDGAGQRVASINNGATAFMVYDAQGKLVAEYGTSSSTVGGTQYLFTDHQGSVRVVMNSTGGVISRHEYEPFGAEMGAGASERHKYAGMEQDEGTELKHTLWRKYESSSGRWTSPDPYGGSMSIADPQSFNRYSYVQNDPVNQIDPLGLMAGADQGWSNAAGGFWGSSAGFDNPHFGGPGAIGEGLMRYSQTTGSPWAVRSGNGQDVSEDPDYTEKIVVEVTAFVSQQSAEEYFRREYTSLDYVAGRLVNGRPTTCLAGCLPASSSFTQWARGMEGKLTRGMPSVPGTPDAIQANVNVFWLISVTGTITKDGDVFAGFETGGGADAILNGALSAETGTIPTPFGASLTGVKIIGKVTPTDRFNFFNGASVMNMTAGYGGIVGGLTFSNGRVGVVGGIGTPAPSVNIGPSYSWHISRTPIRWN
jgi:RHS repeat-associated protein